MALSGGNYGRIFNVVTRSLIDFRIGQVNIYGLHGDITNQELATRLIAGGISGFASKYSTTDGISQYISGAYFRGMGIGSNSFLNWFNNGN